MTNYKEILPAGFANGFHVVSCGVYPGWPDLYRRGGSGPDEKTQKGGARLKNPFPCIKEAHILKL